MQVKILLELAYVERFSEKMMGASLKTYRFDIGDRVWIFDGSLVMTGTVVKQGHFNGGHLPQYHRLQPKIGEECYQLELPMRLDVKMILRISFENVWFPGSHVFSSYVEAEAARSTVVGNPLKPREKGMCRLAAVGRLCH